MHHLRKLKKINRKTKAILLVHVLEASIQIDRLINLVKKNILIIEDTCESLGSKYKNKYLGTYGNFTELFHFIILTKLHVERVEW